MVRVAAGIGLGITLAAVLWFAHTTQSGAAIWVVCPGLALTAMLILGTDDVIRRFQKWIDARPIRIAAVPAILVAFYLAYASGMGIANIFTFLVMAVYLSVPFAVFAPFRDRPRRAFLEPLMILWLWLPLELGVIRSTLITKTTPDLHYVFAQLLAINAGIIAFAVWNRTPEIGYRFEWSQSIALSGAANFVAFAIVAIPLGINIGFIRYSFTAGKLISAPALLAGIFLFTALPEEFLFRGLIQNWIQRTTNSRGVALLLASVIFGASHLNNGPPVPNYRYFLMATIAGLFYGRAWQSTGSLMASASTHALVDACWSVFFR